ncbi:MAG: hypothetical protein ACKVOP_12985 [Sphingomonadaceae bacterium]
MTSYALISLLLGIAMLAVFALTAGGIYMIRTRGDRQRGVLMLVAAVVLFGNVLIWSL